MKHFSLFRRAFFSAVLALTSAASQGSAQSSLDGDKMVSLEILTGWRAQDGTQIAAMKIALAPDWVTYWRVPGEAGIPPQFSLTQSENISGISFSWPRPKAETKFGLQSFVYHDQVIVPMTVTLKNPSAPTRLAGEIQIGVCADVCIPVQLSFDADLPANGAVGTEAIKHALSQGARASNTTATCDFIPSAAGMGVRITAKLPPLKGQEIAVVEHSNQSLWVSPTRVSRNGNTLSVETSLASDTGLPTGLQRSDLRLTVLGESDMVEFIGCRSPS
ncbi:protein-disulfide reductase DsbD domain-containing protein [Falsihalocynthiibacter sp. S25ZX9]|uniref:protein-disulfide reductase DsbD domain-containing protein n=1 Tax=Falsihalocynthiibacter sp. S25ZX9 TaxID=3240870 RepID=UPI00350FA2D8